MYVKWIRHILRIGTIQAELKFIFIIHREHSLILITLIVFIIKYIYIILFYSTFYILLFYIHIILHIEKIIMNKVAKLIPNCKTRNKLIQMEKERE